MHTCGQEYDRSEGGVQVSPFLDLLEPRFGYELGKATFEVLIERDALATFRRAIPPQNTRYAHSHPGSHSHRVQRRGH